MHTNTLQGFNIDGVEVLWTVSGDNVTALTLCDVDGDGRNKLIVGSDDYEIRIFRGEEVISEATETDRVSALCNITGPNYGYALANGTVGVYSKFNRLWRTKMKHTVTAISSFDLDNDGVPELISGWSSGRLEVRAIKDGQLIYKDSLSSPVAALVTADYRQGGKDQLICCSLDGEVRGYLPVEAERQGNLMDRNIHEETLQALNQRRQEMLVELKTYEDSMKQSKTGSEAGLPPDTKIHCRLEATSNSSGLPAVELFVHASNDMAQIRTVAVFSDQVFEEESLVVHPSTPLNILRIPIVPLKNVSTNMFVKVLVSHRGNSHCQVFELVQKLPKFAAYVPVVSGKLKDPESNVTFQLSERTNRVAMWLNQSFIAEVPLSGGPLDVTFLGARDNAVLRITASGGTPCEVTIKTDDIDIAGDIIGDLCEFLGVEELESTAHFPFVMEQFNNLLQQVDEYNAIRLKLTAEMADSSSLIKTLVIKAEDSRLLGDFKSMKKLYTNLYEVNRDIIMEHKKRENNHTGLLESLKQVNQMIQRAARLRVGSSKTRIVAACRSAIKANNIQALFRIIKLGKT